MEKESGDKNAQSIPAAKLLLTHATRLKEVEDDETWISSEELYTEGSSDEENCRCKSNSTIASKDSSLTLPEPQRLRNRAEKKTRSTSVHTALVQKKANPCAQSISENQQSANDSDDEEDDDDEISWKVNRDELVMEDELAISQRRLEEYPVICESTDKIFENYLKKLDCLDEIEKEHYQRQNEKFKEEIKSNIKFFDTAIDELHDKLESIKRKTRSVQLKNRLKLREIIKQGPPESRELAINTKGFFELYTDKDPASLTDTSCDIMKVSEKTESNYSKMAMKLMESLQVSSLTQDFSNMNSLPSNVS